MFRVVLIEHGYASIEVERRIIENAGGEFIDADRLPLAKALELCEEADGILFRRIDVTGEMIRRFRKCKIIVRYGVGTDNVDVKAATDAGIIVGHVPGYCIDEVSSHAVALLLACARKIVVTHKKMEQGGWDVHRNDPIYRMEGKTLGIIGLGQIGRAVARKLSSWDLKPIAHDPFVEPDVAGALGVELASFETVCRQSDYITLHAPLLPETRDLINGKSLALMKPGSMLINTARGPIVNATALLAALDSGRLAGAGIDVFETEPLPADSPLRHHPKIIVTDHTAWYSEESQQDLQRMAAEELARVCVGGLPRSLANPEVLARLGKPEEWTPSDTVKWQLKRLHRVGHKG
ncbi:MAG: C-terminal binding protein [Verrucomicrobia subdivision 3 bacterium]|nr:C-terminal binding protein [Limisphaerales bacterium]